MLCRADGKSDKNDGPPHHHGARYHDGRDPGAFRAGACRTDHRAWEAEARVKAGKAVDYEPMTFRDRLIGIYRRGNLGRAPYLPRGADPRPVNNETPMASAKRDP